jgi:hypothetical protein
VGLSGCWFSVKNVEIHDFSGFDSTLDFLLRWQNEGFLWYRGHEDASWSLRPSVCRVSPARNQTNVLKSFWQRTSGLSGAPLSTDASAWISLAQHHGVHTRALDWTESFLVALYFALDKPNWSDVERDRCDATDSAIWVLNPVRLNELLVGDTNGVLSETEDTVLLTHKEAVYGVRFANLQRPNCFAYQPRYMHERMVVQRSAFTWHNADDPLQCHALAAEFVRVVRIPKNLKSSLRRLLAVMGISDGAVFPDFGGVASEMVKRAPR